MLPSNTAAVTLGKLCTVRLQLSPTSNWELITSSISLRTFLVILSPSNCPHVAVMAEDFRQEPASARVAQGDTAVLRCLAPRGYPDPVTSWLRDGQTLAVGR